MKNLTLGVVGPGQHAQENLLPAIHNLQGVELGIMYGRNSARTSEVARLYGSRSAVVSTTEAILEDKDCDALVVSATPQFHEELLEGAIAIKKPIFVEKPPACTLKAIDRVAHMLLAAEQPAIVQFGFNFRFSDFYQQLVTTFENDSMQYMRIKSFAAKPNASMWGLDDLLRSSLLAVHIHAIEMLCYTLGEVKNVSSNIVWLDQTKYIATVTVMYEGGKLGVLELSNASNRFEFEVECVGSNGTIFRCYDFNQMEIFGAEVCTDTRLPSKSVMRYTVPFLRGGFDRTGYSRQFEKFRESIMNNTLDRRAILSCLDAYKIMEEIV